MSKNEKKVIISTPIEVDIQKGSRIEQLKNQQPSIKEGYQPITDVVTSPPGGNTPVSTSTTDSATTDSTK